jgi:hypothetical protein
LLTSPMLMSTWMALGAGGVLEKFDTYISLFTRSIATESAALPSGGIP